MADQDETGVVDFYLESYHERDGQAQYDAWISGRGEPFDFTGSSYLEEWTRPLREMTPLMGRFNEWVTEAWKSITWGWCKWPTLTQADLEFMAEIDQCIFEDGDYFLRRDPGFLDDSRKLEILAMGRELAALSRDFWERLHELGRPHDWYARQITCSSSVSAGKRSTKNHPSIAMNSLRPSWITCPHMEEAKTKGLEINHLRFRSKLEDRW